MPPPLPVAVLPEIVELLTVNAIVKEAGPITIICPGNSHARNG